MTLGPPPRCRCGNLATQGNRTCGLAICSESNATDDSDETEGRALYRARADKLARSQLSIARRAIRIAALTQQEGGGA